VHNSRRFERRRFFPEKFKPGADKFSEAEGRGRRPELGLGLRFWAAA
jgi:hypothetical protein